MPGSHPFCFDGPVEVIAHRGYSARAPENTLVAMELALVAGADALEFDLHTAFDGTPFLFHDATLERTTDGEGPIGSATPEQLALLDAGGWFGEEYRGERIPTLERLLEAFGRRARRLYAEVKQYGDGAHLERIVDLVRGSDRLERTVFISMDWDALERIRASSADALLGYIVERADRTDEGLGRARGDPGALLDFDAEVLLGDPSIAERAHAESIALATWTVNDVATAARLLELGVRRLTTNEVGPLVEWKSTL